jgi:hypothetical protein
LGGVLGEIAVRRDHHCKRFADIADLAGCEYGLIGNGELMLYRLAPGFGRAVLHAGDGLEMRRDVLAGEDGYHAGCGKSRLGCDRANARMGDIAAHEGGVQHAGKRDVGDEAAAAEQEPPILAPGNGLADEPLHPRCPDFVALHR